MRRLLLCLLAVVAGASALKAQDRDLPIFPGASGFGTTTVAGSGRHLKVPTTTVYRVTNLKDSGAGSLREAFEAEGPRTVVFEVSGTISLKKHLRVQHPFITVAGQTAPSPGITLKGAGIVVESHDVLIQHLRVRVGDDPEGPNPVSRDGLGVIGKAENVYNVVIDHVSLSWAIDENASTGDGPKNITFSRCVFSEALRDSIHPKTVKDKGNPKAYHSMGMLVGPRTDSITVHGSVFAHNNDRNPRVEPGTSMEFLNNLIYNWGGGRMCNLSEAGFEGGPIRLHLAGNYYKPGKDSLQAPIIAGTVNAETKVWVEHNVGPTRTADKGDEWVISSLPRNHQAARQLFNPSGVKVKAPDVSYKEAVASAGARPGDRDDVDVRIFKDIEKGTGSMKDSVNGSANPAGGWPELAKKTRKFVEPAKPFDVTKEGYTNLEKALHAAAAEVEKTAKK